MEIHSMFVHSADIAKEQEARLLREFRKLRDLCYRQQILENVSVFVDFENRENERLRKIRQKNIRQNAGGKNA